jgi:hypothetical protein
VEQIPRQGPPTRIGGKSKDLRDAIMSVLRDRHEAPLFIVAVIDARLDEIDDLEKDVGDILRQCEERVRDVPVAIGLAIQEIEIWMMADPESRRAAFGDKGLKRPIPSNLEAVGDPKALWSELAGTSPAPEGKSAAHHADDQRSAAWRALRPDVVKNACPRGFAPLLERLTRCARLF